MTGFIENLIAQWGPLGVAFLMLLENVFPPIPSEIVMPVAGLVAAHEETSLVLVVLAGAMGSLAGATLWFIAGRAFSLARIHRLAARHGRWLTVDRARIDRAQAWFERWGHMAVLIGRLVPAVRTFISVPAGLSRMRWSTFLVFSAIGSLLWVAGLAIAGYWLGDKPDLVATYLSPISDAVLVLLICIYVWRVLTFKPGNRSEEVHVESREETGTGRSLDG